MTKTKGKTHRTGPVSTSVARILEQGEGRGRGATFKGIIAKYFLNLMKNSNPQIQENKSK